MSKITVILFLLVFLSPLDSTFAQTPSKFWIRSLEGKRFESKKEKSPYVLSFFFVNCIPCIKEIPELYKFMNTNYPNVHLLFIDPSRKIQRKIFKNFLKYWTYHHHISTRTPSERSLKNSLKGECLFLLFLV